MHARHAPRVGSGRTLRADRFRLLVVRLLHFALAPEDFPELGLGDVQRVVASRQFARVHLRLQIVLSLRCQFGVAGAGITATREFVVEHRRTGMPRSLVILRGLEVLFGLLILNRELRPLQAFHHVGIVHEFGHGRFGDVEKVHGLGALAAVVDRAAGGVVLRLDRIRESLRPQLAVLVKLDQLAEEVVCFVEVAADEVHVTAPEQRFIGERAAKVVRVNVLERFDARLSCTRNGLVLSSGLGQCGRQWRTPFSSCRFCSSPRKSSNQ